MRLRISTVLPYLLALLMLPSVAPPAAAAGTEIVEVRVYVTDPDSNQFVAVVGPGEVLTLPPAAAVRLRMAAVPRQLDRRWPSARFEVEAEVGVEVDDGILAKQRGEPMVTIGDANVERGNATLKTRRGEGESAVRYTILPDAELSITEELRSGHFTVRVRRGTELEPLTDPVAEEPEPEADVDLIGELYRAILMREPEPAAVESYRQRLGDAPDYAQAIALATEIAESDESRVALYRRGVSYEERLAALYEHLAGIDPKEVDAERWRADLELLRDGRIDQIVDAMVRSPGFRERHGYDRRSRRRTVVPRQ